MNTGVSETKKLTTLAMLTALAYVVMALSKMLPPFIPAAPFLSYDPKHVIVAISGFIFGPLAAFSIAFVVSLIEMFTISATGIIGLVMNVLATSTYACTAAFIYRYKHNLKGAVLALIAGSLALTVVMLLWNYLLTPIFTGDSREAVIRMLLPAILPFNLIQAGLNTGITLLLYKPLVTALRKVHLIDAPESAGLDIVRRKKTGIALLALLLLTTCVLVILVLRDVI
ncbi:MAG: ECF transporter S component [Oscillospiraceae bacterium]|jgi:riboflavin transporter FmnP|nr:ECF transporter S component [Oscillospiraceae bacterium]